MLPVILVMCKVVSLKSIDHLCFLIGVYFVFFKMDLSGN